MPYLKQIAAEKANIINRNKNIYGSFAEIGAGQEVVNCFFKAGLASQTVAKSMSAYDMVFSDLIYGKAERYVCEERLLQMLNHEYKLLQDRLGKTRGADTCFFAFADTAASSTFAQNKTAAHHGWMGVRFQSNPRAKYSEILLHLNLMDRARLQQYEALGVLGVNLIHTAFYGKASQKNLLIKSLVDNFEKSRVEIDALKCQGFGFTSIDPISLNLELLRQNITNIVVFAPKVLAPADAFYDKALLLYTDKTSLKEIKKAEKKIKSAVKENLTAFITLKHPASKASAFAKKHIPVIVHRSLYWHELKNTLRRFSEKPFVLCLSLKELDCFLDEKSYLKKGMTLISALGLFFDSKTKIFTPVEKKTLLLRYKNKNYVKGLIEKNLILAL